MGIRSKYFSTTKNGITHKSMHIHYYYSMPDRGETKITQIVILNLNGISYIQRKHFYYLSPLAG